jgi:hypothetical protein
MRRKAVCVRCVEGRRRRAEIGIRQDDDGSIVLGGRIGDAVEIRAIAAKIRKATRGPIGEHSDRSRVRVRVAPALNKRDDAFAIALEAATTERFLARPVRAFRRLLG